MGYHFQRRPIQSGGLRDISGGGAMATTKGLALSTGTFSTNTSITLGAFFKTSGAIIPGRVVKLSSAGNIRHTTGSSGRRAMGVALTSASTAAVALHGIVFLQVSTAAVKRGSVLVPTSGAISTGSQLGGNANHATLGVGANHSHVQACGVART